MIILFYYLYNSTTLNITELTIASSTFGKPNLKRTNYNNYFNLNIGNNTMIVLINIYYKYYN